MFVSREKYRTGGEIRSEKSGVRGEIERRKEKNLDSGDSVVLGCRDEEKREKIRCSERKGGKREDREGNRVYHSHCLSSV